MSENDVESISTFGLKVLKKSFDEDGEENIMISPLSIYTALAMCANGASSLTLSEMQGVLGMDLSSMNKFFYDYMRALSEEEGIVKMSNSIWIKDSKEFKVNEDFLAINKNIYDSEVYMADFSKGTLKDINAWVENKTDGTIKEILDKINKDAIMYLINAILFEAKWENEYEKGTFERDFNLEDGSKQKADYMFFQENGYISSDDFTGFIKYYDGRKYGFVALLPDEDIKMKDFITNLESKNIDLAIKNSSDEKVEIVMPKFKVEYKKELSEVLASLGMASAFNYDTVDFSKMGKLDDSMYKLLIERIIHQSYIEVNEIGTKAGAATVVEMKKEGSMLEEKPPKEVLLNRPFVYIIWDFENNIPIFVGDIVKINK